MSLVWMDGFETEGQQNQRWTNWYESQSQQNGQMTQIFREGGSAIRTGGAGIRLYKYQSLSAGTTGAQIQKVFSTSDFTSNTMILGFGFKYSYYLYTQNNFASIREQGDSYRIGLRFDSNYKLQVANKNGTVLATGNYPLGANTQYYIQMKLKADATNGEIIVKLGSQTDISISGINTATTGNKVDNFYFQVGDAYPSLPTSQNANIYFDDIYVVVDDGIAPTDFLGVVGIYGSLPSAVGDRNDFENYGGTNPVTLVSEGSADTGTYVYGDGLNEKVLFEFSDITTLPGGIIKGVFIYDYAARSASGEGASKYRLIFRDSTDTEYEMADTTLADANQYQHLQKYVKNPITDTTQDTTSLNAMQFGIKVTQVD